MVNVTHTKATPGSFDVRREYFGLTVFDSGTSRQQLLPSMSLLWDAAKCQVGPGSRPLPQCSIGSSDAGAAAGSSAGWATWDTEKSGLARRLQDLSETMKAENLRC